MTDANGNQIGATVKYLPFGETRMGSVPTDKLFTGQRLDSTGLYYYNARYYDPTIGRFIGPDTIIPYPNDPQSFNRYSYCRNNPLKYTDPTGNLDSDYLVLMQYLEKQKAVQEALNDLPAGYDSGLSNSLLGTNSSQSLPANIAGILATGTGGGISLPSQPSPSSILGPFAGAAVGVGTTWAIWKLDPNIIFTKTAIIDRTIKGGGRILSVHGPHEGATYWHFNSDVKPLSYLDHFPTPLVGRGLKYAAKGVVVAGLAVDARDLYTSYQADGRAFGTNTQHAVGRVLGGWDGAFAGAIIGSAFGPAGTLIGGIIGGILGSWAGESLAN